MTLSRIAAGAGIGAAIVALLALALVHVLKPEVDPRRNMISLYALGRFGWLMTICFAALGAASVCVFAALVGGTETVAGRTGLGFLLGAGVGLEMAGSFPMDPIGTPPAQRSYSGKMHGVVFLIGVPCQLLATLLVSVAPGRGPWGDLLLPLAAVVWLSLIAMTVVMVRVGPGKEPDPNGPVRFLGVPNRFFMIGYALWLIAAARGVLW